MRDEISGLLQRYMAESQKSITDTAPSALRRGEGTLCDYYILKVDLCGSTEFLRRKQHSTYLRLAHVFLSTIDHITKEYGAENNQNEYAGDGIIAYFPCDKVSAFDVLLAAFYCKSAAEQMKGSYPTFKDYKFETKVVLHKAELIVAKIGPRGLSRVTAIGFGLHRACKLEQKLTASQGRATIEFVKSLDRRYSAKFMFGNYVEEIIPITPVPTAPRGLLDFATALDTRQLNRPSARGMALQAIAQPAGLGMRRPLSDFAVTPEPTQSIRGLLSSALQRPTTSLSDLSRTVPTVTMPPISEVKKILEDYTICWGPLRMYTEGRLPI